MYETCKLNDVKHMGASVRTQQPESLKRQKHTHIHNHCAEKPKHREELACFLLGVSFRAPPLVPKAYLQAVGWDGPRLHILFPLKEPRFGRLPNAAH